MATDYGSFFYPPAGTGGGGGVTTLNGESGAVNIVAGTGITVTPAGQSITIAATGGGGFTPANLTDVGTDGITITGGTNAVNGSGTSISQHVADSIHNGYLSSTDWSTFNSKQAAGSYITALTGDVTATGPGSVAATLATVNGNVGSFGSSTSIPNFTVNAKGLLTAAGGNVVIAPAGTLSGTTLNATVINSSLSSLGAQAQALDMNTHLINNVINPVSAQDAATKAYVDASVPVGTPNSVAYFNGSSVLSNDPNVEYTTSVTPAFPPFPMRGFFAKTDVITGTPPILSFGALDTAIDSPAVDILFMSGSNTAVAAANDTGDIASFTGSITDATSTARSGAFSLNSGNNQGTGASGGISLETGASVNGSSGSIQCQTGQPSGSGNSGNVFFNTGQSLSGNSGQLNFDTGNSISGGLTGDINFRTGDTNVSGSSASGTISILTGASFDGLSGNIDMSTGTPNGIADSGAFNFFTGQSGPTGKSGDANLGSGPGGGVGDTGALNLTTGQSNGNSGNVFLRSGDASGGNSGNIKLLVGTATGTRGLLQLQNGTEGTAGQVWTSTDTNGSGAWMDSNSLPAPLEALASYTSNFWGAPSTFIGNNSNTDQTNQTILLGSDDTAIAANATSNVVLIAGDNTNAASTGSAGGVFLQAGNIVNGTGQGGETTVTAGSSDSANGGQANLVAGNSNTGQGGSIGVIGGNALSGAANGGNVQIQSGNSFGANGGNVLLIAGTGGAVDGNIQLEVNPTGKIRLQDASIGTAGQVWTSTDVSGSGTWAPTGAISGHITSTQSTPPSVAPNANAGTGATSTLSNATDVAGKLELVTGTLTLSSGAQTVVTFNIPYSVAPIVVITPQNATAAQAAVAAYVTSTTTTFTVNFAVASVGSQTFDWFYHVIETQ